MKFLCVKKCFLPIHLLNDKFNNKKIWISIIFILIFKQIINYFDIEINDFIQIENQQNNFKLISAESINKINYKHIPNESLKYYDLSYIINFLYEIEVFLLDVNLITKKNIQKSQSKLERNETKSIDFVDIYENILKGENYDSEISITFGVFSKSFTNLDKALNNKLNKKICYFDYVFSYYDLKKVLTGIYLKCGNLLIQVPIVYERGLFFWIGDNDLITKNIKIFGDTPRALKKFSLSTILDNKLNKFYVHSNLRQFLYEYPNSKFLECNKSLLNENKNKIGSSYWINPRKKRRLEKDLEYVTNSLESFYKNYWLDSGTLLGWYRDCGFFPHVTDIDISMYSEEYETKIKKHFLGNEQVYIRTQFGLVNLSLEFQMSGNFQVDLFFNYKHNSTHLTIPYQSEKKKYKMFGHKFKEICSAELYNKRYYVPCEPVECLDVQYGKNNWLTPESTNFKFVSLVFDRLWTDHEMLYAYRSYYPNGKLKYPPGYNLTYDDEDLT